VTFETNSAKLTPDSQAVLDHVVFSLRDWTNVKVEIGGHTDAAGSDDHNLSLSQARADSVRDYLVSQGVDGSRLVAKGYGESDPIADNKTAHGRAKNRRVELTKVE
jgi:OmpA-OmpF porin, OOP family